MQTTDTILAVRPVNFGFNNQTAMSNMFMNKDYNGDPQSKALAEFDGFVKELRDVGIKVIVVDDLQQPPTPDSIFPNNWFSTHTKEEVERRGEPLSGVLIHNIPKTGEPENHIDDMRGGEIREEIVEKMVFTKDKIIVLYPMLALNRREERNKNVLPEIKTYYKEDCYTVDLTYYEKDDLFLEGTGSMVLDRENKIIYACRSPRTDTIIIHNIAGKLNYRYVIFTALDKKLMPIYHTNVMMSIGTTLAIICPECIQNKEERDNVMSIIRKTGKIIVELTKDQVDSFAGNMLELHITGENGEKKSVMLMSAKAKSSLTQSQLGIISQYAIIVAPDVSCIEYVGGGSVRCMSAEIF